MSRPSPGPSGRLDAAASRFSQAHSGDREAQAARSARVLRYAKAVRTYVGAIIENKDEADKLAHDIVARLLKGDFAGARPTGGRFRDLLKTAVCTMLPRGSQKPGEDPWLAAWRTSVVDHAWGMLKDYEKANPKKPAHSLLRLRTDFPDDTPEQFAQKFCQKTGLAIRPEVIRQMLQRARQIFAEHLVREIRLGLDDPSPTHVQEELAALDLLDQVKGFLSELPAGA